MSSQSIRFTKGNLLLIIVLLMISVLGIYPFATNILQGRIVTSYVLKTQKVHNLILKDIISNNVSEIKSIMKPWLKPSKIKQIIKGTQTQKQWDKHFLKIGLHLKRKHDLLYIASYNENILSPVLSYRPQDSFLSTKDIRKAYEQHKAQGGIHFIYDKYKNPILTFSITSKKNNLIFRHIFFLGLKQIVKKYSSLNQNIIQFNIGNKKLFSRPWTKKNQYKKISNFLYQNKSKQTILIKKIKLNPNMFNTQATSTLLINRDLLTFSLKKTKEYEILILTMVFLFIIPTITLFILYHVGFYRKIFKSLREVSNFKNINFTKNDIGQLATFLNNIQKSFKHNKFLIKSIINSEHNNFFYFDKNGNLGKEMSDSSIPIMEYFDKRPNIYEIFGHLANANIEHLKNITDLIWDSGDLIELDKLLEGFPSALLHPKGRTVRLKYNPITNDKNELIGISVFFFNK